MPEKSGLPSGVCGVGADKLGLPSGVVGTPAVGYFIHWAKAIAVQLKALANTIPRVSSEPRIDAYSAPVMLLIIAKLGGGFGPSRDLSDHGRESKIEAMIGPIMTMNSKEEEGTETIRLSHSAAAVFFRKVERTMWHIEHAGLGAVAGTRIQEPIFRASDLPSQLHVLDVVAENPRIGFCSIGSFCGSRSGSTEVNS